MCWVYVERVKKHTSYIHCPNEILASKFSISVGKHPVFLDSSFSHLTEMTIQVIRVGPN